MSLIKNGMSIKIFFFNMIQNYISCFAAKTPASVSDKLRLHRLKIEKFQPGYGSDEMAFATVQ